MLRSSRSVRDDRGHVKDAGMDLNDPQSFGEYVLSLFIVCLSLFFDGFQIFQRHDYSLRRCAARRSHLNLFFSFASRISRSGAIQALGERYCAVDFRAGARRNAARREEAAATAASRLSTLNDQNAHMFTPSRHYCCLCVAIFKYIYFISKYAR